MKGSKLQQRRVQVVTTSDSVDPLMMKIINESDCEKNHLLNRNSLLRNSKR